MELSATRLLWHLLRRTRLLCLAGAGMTTDESRVSLLGLEQLSVLRVVLHVGFFLVCFLKKIMRGWNDFTMLAASCPSLILYGIL